MREIRSLGPKCVAGNGITVQLVKHSQRKRGANR